jgi:hypothetical protein
MDAGVGMEGPQLEFVRPTPVAKRHVVPYVVAYIVPLLGECDLCGVPGYVIFAFED